MGRSVRHPSACDQPNAEQDLEADRVATNLPGLEGPVAQGLGDSCIHLGIWTLLDKDQLGDNFDIRGRLDAFRQRSLIEVLERTGQS